MGSEYFFHGKMYSDPIDSCSGDEGLKQDYLQMRVLELAPQVYVSGQLFEHDVRLAAKQGVRSIMNNRPDGESIGQPLSADLAKVAEELGMTFLHFPIDPRAITSQDVEVFAKARDELERPLNENLGDGRVRVARAEEMGSDPVHLSLLIVLVSAPPKNRKTP